MRRNAEAFLRGRSCGPMGAAIPALILWGAALLAGCSGDLFHSTDWPSRCDKRPMDLDCTSATSTGSSGGGGGAGGASSGSTSSGSGAGGGGGASATSSGGSLNAGAG